MKLVIFDMDGTTVNTLDTIAYYVNYALEKCGLSTLNNGHIKKFTGEGMRMLIKRSVEEACGDDTLVEKVEKIYKSAYDSDPMYLTRPYDGIIDMLKALKEMGIKTAIVSNKPHNLTVQISEKLFGSLIDEVLGAKPDLPLKPDPYQVLKVIEHFGAEKDECLYVGDTATDIETAKNAGLFSIGVVWGFRGWDELTEADADMITDRVPEIVRAASVESVKNYRQKNYIPYYWANHLEEKIDKVHKNQIRAGKHGMSFGLISDIHWHAKHIQCSAAILEKVADDCAIPYIFNGGDTVSGAGTCPPERLFDELSNYSRDFINLESKMLMALGNHDSTYSEFEPPRYYAQNLTKEEIYEYIFRYETKYPDRVMSEDGSYFYADSKFYKTRLVVMNPYDVPNDDVDEDGSAKYNKMRLAGYRQTQIEWFANEALNVPSKEWTVVLCTHTNPASGKFCRNEDVLLKIIKAYRDKTSYELKSHFDDIHEYNIQIKGDFLNRGGEFAVWVSGHTHTDEVTVADGTLCIAIISDWNHQAQGLPFMRDGGTVFEHAFDIYTIDPEKHKLYVARIGAGQDREFDYTPGA